MNLLFCEFRDAMDLGKSFLRKRKDLLWLASGRYSSVAFNFMVVPLSYRYVGEHDFNIWAALSSYLAFSSFVDLGLCNSFVNKVASMRLGRDGVVTALLSTYAWALVVIGIISSCIVGIVIWLNSRILDLVVNNLPLTGWVLSFIVLSSFLLITFSLGERYFLATGQAAKSGKNQIVSTLIGSLLVGLIWWQDLGEIAFIGAVVLSPVIGKALLCLSLPKSELKSSSFFTIAGRFPFSEIKSGFRFTILQALAGASVSYDASWLAIGGKLDSAGQYQVMLRVINALQIAQFFAAVDWPKYSQSMASGKLELALKIYRKSISTAAWTGIIMAVVFICSAQFLMALLTGNNVSADWVIVILFGLYLVVSSIGSALCAILNTEQFLSAQIALYVTCIIIACVLKFIFFSGGAAAFMASNVIVFGGIFLLVGNAIVRKKLLSNA